MNQDNRESDKDASTNIPMKRKRGRPRKHPRPSFNHGENSVERIQNLYHMQNAHVPPGFQGMNRDQSPPVEPLDVMVGQVVRGVIEASFDAGYLLNVKVGNSETTLRGVVFKPGQYVPVSAANDVAPHVQMVKRNEIPLPAERNEQHVKPCRNGTTNLGALKGKQRASVPVQTAHPVISRNIFQPVNLPNGRGVVNHRSSVSNQVNHMEDSKAKQVMEAVIPSNGSLPTNQVQMGGNPLQAQTNSQGMLSQPPEELLEAEAKSMKLPGLPFEKLLTEVIKRIQAPPSQSVETQIGDKHNDTDEEGQALSVEPLQVVQSNVDTHSASLSKPFENFRTGKMTELLRVR